MNSVALIALVIGFNHGINTEYPYLCEEVEQIVDQMARDCHDEEL